jgi:hypothetical protein
MEDDMSKYYQIITVKGGTIVSRHTSEEAAKRAAKRLGSEWGYVAAYPRGLCPDVVVGAPAKWDFRDGSWLVG